MIILMLLYEEKRQKALLEQSWMKHRISRQEKEDREHTIQMYMKYVQALKEQFGEELDSM